MLKRLRRPLMALGIAGVVTASALGAGIGSSGTAHAEGGCHTHIHVVPVYSGTGGTVIVKHLHCTGTSGSTGERYNDSYYFVIATITY